MTRPLSENWSSVLSTCSLKNYIASFHFLFLVGTVLASESDP